MAVINKVWSLSTLRNSIISIKYTPKITSPFGYKLRPSYLNSRSYASNPKIKKKYLGTPITWGGLAVFVVVGAGSLAYVRHVQEEQQNEREAQEKRSVGMMNLGGPFELVDVEGNEVTDESFLGKWVLIYFGFCHCPDICPDQLEKITVVVDKVNAMNSVPDVQPVFITVDPERDTKEHIKEYLKDFHPSFIGLTGTKAQVKRVCKAYRVYFSSGPQDEDEDYIVDHTVIQYLLDPEGRFSQYFGQNKRVNEIVTGISAAMAKQR